MKLVYGRHGCSSAGEPTTVRNWRSVCWVIASLAVASGLLIQTLILPLFNAKIQLNFESWGWLRQVHIGFSEESETRFIQEGSKADSPIAPPSFTSKKRALTHQGTAKIFARKRFLGRVRRYVKSDQIVLTAAGPSTLPKADSNSVDSVERGKLLFMHRLLTARLMIAMNAPAALTASVAMNSTFALANQDTEALAEAKSSSISSQRVKPCRTQKRRHEADRKIASVERSVDEPTNQDIPAAAQNAQAWNWVPEDFRSFTGGNAKADEPTPSLSELHGSLTSLQFAFMNHALGRPESEPSSSEEQVNLATLADLVPSLTPSNKLLSRRSKRFPAKPSNSSPMDNEMSTSISSLSLATQVLASNSVNSVNSSPSGMAPAASMSNQLPSPLTLAMNTQPGSLTNTQPSSLKSRILVQRAHPLTTQANTQPVSTQPAPSPMDTQPVVTQPDQETSSLSLVAPEPAQETPTESINPPPAYVVAMDIHHTPIDYASSEMVSNEPIFGTQFRRGWQLSMATDFWPTLTWTDPVVTGPASAPILGNNEKKTFEIIAKMDQQTGAGIVFGRIARGWEVVRLSDRPEPPIFLDIVSKREVGTEAVHIDRYFAFLNATPGAQMVYVNSRNGDGSGTVAVPVLAGTASYLDLTQFSRKTLVGRVMEPEFPYFNPLGPIQDVRVSVVDQNVPVAMTNSTGYFQIEQVLTVSSYPVFVETEHEYGPKHRHRVLPQKMQNALLYRIPAERIQGWLGQVKGGISEESGLVVTALPEMVAFNPKAELLPSIYSIPQYLNLTPATHTPTKEGHLRDLISMRNGQLSDFIPLQQTESHFIGVQIPEGLFRSVVEQDGNITWSELSVASPRVVNMIGPY